MTRAKGKAQAKKAAQMTMGEMFRAYPATKRSMEVGTKFGIKEGETPARAKQIAFETVRAEVAKGEYDESTRVLTEERVPPNGTPFTLRRTIQINHQDGSGTIHTQGYCSSMTYVNDDTPDMVFCLTCNERTMLVPGINYDQDRPYRCKRDKNTPVGFYGSTHDIVVWCREHRCYEELK